MYDTDSCIKHSFKKQMTKHLFTSMERLLEYINLKNSA